ncbi:MAG: hypothetical protein LBS17_03665 [Actinomycetes bacterium]|jgi:hypothetical protein|nr:hypothetical protein [Actinomycetes bacterium]
MNKLKLHCLLVCILCASLLLGTIPAASAVDAVDPSVVGAAVGDSASTVDTSAATRPGADGITPFEQMMVNVINNSGQKVAIVGGFLSEQAPLPAQVEVAVPAGAAVFWVGEVGGSESQSDDVELPQNKRTEGDFDIYSATMTNSRSIQVEYTLPDDPFVNTGDNTYTGTLSYTPIRDVTMLFLAAEVPTNATVSDTNFVSQGTGGSGGMIYSRGMGPAQAGQTVTAQLQYTTGTQQGGTTAAGSNTTLTIIIVVVVVAIAACVFLLMRRRMG